MKEEYVENVAKALEMLAENVRSGDISAFQFTGLSKSIGLAEMLFLRDGTIMEMMLLTGPVEVNSFKLKVGILQLQEIEAKRVKESKVEEEE